MIDSARIEILEAKLRRTQFALAMVAVCAVAVMLGTRATATAANTDKNVVIHARGLIIDDEQGRSRIVIGAPTPPIAGRTRQESLTGILLIGENGADRIQIAYPGLEPQVQGNVVKRSIQVPSAGIIINDASGNERSGWGVSDDGNRVSIGMDYADRDALGLIVSPTFTGLAGFARNGERNDQMIMAVLKDGTSTFKLADSNGDEGLIVEDKKDRPLKVQVRNPSTKRLDDVVGKHH